MGILLQWAPSIHSFFFFFCFVRLLLIFRLFCVCPVARLPATTIPKMSQTHTGICKQAQQQQQQYNTHTLTPNKIRIHALAILHMNFRTYRAVSLSVSVCVCVCIV